MEMVRVTPARIYPASAFFAILYTGRKISKIKKRIIYTYEMNTAIIHSERQRVHPASTPIEASGAAGK